jgi:ribonuclease Z
MLTTIAAGPYTITGVSVGGVYTSLLVKELDIILDAGAAPRSFVGGRHLLISHAHADHIGALPSLIGMRGLSRSPTPQVLLPRESHEDVALAMDALIRAQHRPVQVPWVPIGPGEEHALSGDILVRAFRTRHTIPSLGYVIFRRVRKLRPEHHSLDTESIRARRLAGEDLFFTEERLELAYEPTRSSTCSTSIRNCSRAASWYSSALSSTTGRPAKRRAKEATSTSMRYWTGLPYFETRPSC